MVQEYHLPVLLNEVIRLFDPKPGQTYVDCTLGGGGHAKAILSRITPGGHLIGIDRDQDALDKVKPEFDEFSGSVSLVRGDFADLEQILKDLGISSVDGVLFDLGVSSHQLDAGERGFSFSVFAPLDMRMDQRQPRTAADLVNQLPEKELADLIYQNSDERWSRRIAKAIVERRQNSPILTTKDLAEIVSSVIPRGAHPQKIHPATRTFQALRIAVNSEMEQIDRGFAAAVAALKPGGVVSIISYHSLEDRKAKQFLAVAAGRCQCPPGLPACVCGAQQVVKILTKKPVVPTPEEIEANPRSRSAKLRVAQKIES